MKEGHDGLWRALHSFVQSHGLDIEASVTQLPLYKLKQCGVDILLYEQRANATTCGWPTQDLSYAVRDARPHPYVTRALRQRYPLPNRSNEIRRLRIGACCFIIGACIGIHVGISIRMRIHADASMGIVVQICIRIGIAVRAPTLDRPGIHGNINGSRRRRLPAGHSVCRGDSILITVEISVGIHDAVQVVRIRSCCAHSRPSSQSSSAASVATCSNV